MKKIICLILSFLNYEYLFAQYIQDSVYVQSEFRYYNVHVPVNYNGFSNLPLVLGFHGGGNQGWGNLDYYSEFKNKSDSAGFLLIFPEGKKYTSSIFYGWNAGTCCYPNSTNNTDDIGFVNILLDTLLHHFNIDTNKIYAFGNSAGGMFSLRLACEMSQRFAAIGVSNGTQTFYFCNPIRAVPIINIHSLADSVVFFAGGIGNQSVVYGVNLISQDSLTKFWQSLNSCQTSDTIHNGGDTSFTFIQTHNCDCSEITFDNYFTSDGGHTWAGGPPTGSTSVSNQISSTELMWDFFANHTLHECEDTLINNQKPIIKKEISIFPNPTTTKFTINTTGNGLLSIYDLLGNKIFEKLIVNNSEQINFQPSSNGVFIAKLINSEYILEKKLFFFSDF